MLDPKLVLVDDIHPRLTSHSVAVRISGAGDPGGRSIMKHLGIWEGSNCYYCIGNISKTTRAGKKRDGGDNRKFLIYDGVVATNAEPVYHRCVTVYSFLQLSISLFPFSGSHLSINILVLSYLLYLFLTHCVLSISLSSDIHTHSLSLTLTYQDSHVNSSLISTGSLSVCNGSHLDSTCDDRNAEVDARVGVS